MDVINKFKVELIRLSIEHLELMRYWRNSEDVKQHMLYQQHITKQQHLNWFSSINNKSNYYYIIKADDDFRGVVNLKDIDILTKEAESGIFMFGKENWGGGYAVRSTYAILDFGFSQLGLNAIKCTILADNKNAIAFNKALGVDLKVSKDSAILLGRLEKDVFYKKMNRYINFI